MRMLHVWWARRPLAVSRAAVAASLLPAWPSEDEALGDDQAARILSALGAEFASQEEYHRWFMDLLAIKGDPVASRAKIRHARELGVRFAEEAYGYPRAFTVNPPDEAIARLHRLATAAGHKDNSAILDPFAGGGSIPYEALRLGFRVIANELNPVAVAVLKATIEYPRTYGIPLGDVIERWGRVWSSKVERALSLYYPIEGEGPATDYVWAHTVACPSTGRATPLCPDFWLLNTDGRQVALQLDADSASGVIRFGIVEGRNAPAVAAAGTYKRGVGKCIWCQDETFDGDYIKRQAMMNKIGQMLLAVVVERPGRAGRGFRVPSTADLEALSAAEAALAQNEGRWLADDLIPTEEIAPGEKTDEPRKMGLLRWRDMFAPRQLLANCTILEAMQQTLAEASEQEANGVMDALNLYFALAFDKCVDYNGRLSSWDASRNKVRNTFDRHDFAFKWSFAEFEGAHGLVQWSIDMLLTNYREVAGHLAESAETKKHQAGSDAVRLILGTAANIPVESGSMDAIVMDPPYYDNVIYSECSDYFYVWLKRSIRGRFPELAQRLDTDKDEEAVANEARFSDVATVKRRTKGQTGATAGELADKHYEDRMRAAFSECHRLLRENGVMTVMFTHKRVDAWDTLGAALLAAGFTIDSSWPVHTESRHSLHQARKNAASSTILLTCRKRSSAEPAWWEDVRPAVSRAAREAATRFAEAGLRGVDLTISTFGPVLGILSERWPVYSGEVDPVTGKSAVLRPDRALDLARAEVARLKKRGLLGGRDVQFDSVTDFYLMAWNDFAARQFPAGEALKLAIASGLELDDLIRRERLLSTASGFVEILAPAARRARDAFDISASTFPYLVDLAQALMLIYHEEGERAAATFLAARGRDGDAQLRDLMQALLNVIPRDRDAKGEFLLPEAGMLEDLRLTLFSDLEPPTKDEMGVQMALIADIEEEVEVGAEA
jgi:adenine-specific DNA methylase